MSTHTKMCVLVQRFVVDCLLFTLTKQSTHHTWPHTHPPTFSVPAQLSVVVLRHRVPHFRSRRPAQLAHPTNTSSAPAADASAAALRSDPAADASAAAADRSAFTRTRKPIRPIATIAPGATDCAPAASSAASPAAAEWTKSPAADCSRTPSTSSGSP